MIFVICSFLALNALSAVLSSSSTNLKFFDPINAIKADYESFDPISGSQLKAEFNMETSRPAVNLANFAQIVRVDCKSLFQVNLEFADLGSAQSAYRSWNGTYVVLYLDHSYECGGSAKVQAVTIESLNLKATTLSLSTAPIELKEVIQDFEMSITRAQISKPIHIPVAFNYDIQTQQIKNPAIDMFQYNIVTGVCANCYGNGSIDFEFTMKGSFILVKEYKFKLTGILDASLDLALNLKKSGDITAFRKRLYEYPFGIMTIPGILTFSPKAILETAISFQTDNSGSITFGADISIPINFEAGSTKGLLGKPAFQSTSSPSIHPHPLTIKSGKVGVEGHVIPQVTLDISVFHIPAFDFLLELDNAIGLELVSDGNGCLGTGLYHRHLFGFNAASGIINWNKHVDFYNSGKVAIECPLCHKCK